jgi:hypothetical protein
MPLGYWVVYKWLQNFPYRISIQWWMFAFAGLLMLTIAMITLSTRTIRRHRQSDQSPANRIENLLNHFNTEGKYMFLEIY